LNMIQLRHVFKKFPNGATVLSDISLEIAQGEFAYIAGPGGSGKSTLLRVLFGAEKPTAGEVTVNGFELTQKGFSGIYRLRRSMGVVFHDSKLLKDRSVARNIEFALEATGHLDRRARDRVYEILTRVGLQERRSEPIAALSAGEKRRVAIARALVNDPCLLLVDEPTENLDVRITTDVMSIFSQLHKEGKTIVFATQDMDLIRLNPSRTIRIAEGKRVDEVNTET
jgi:cell division transport system ATP-binding protein